MRVMADASEEPEPGPARRAARELMSKEFLDGLMARVEEGGLRLTGEGGFLPELVKAVLERGLDAELTDHLGYERGDPAAVEFPNSRNGSTPKTLETDVGPVGLDTHAIGPARSTRGWSPRAAADSAGWRR
jgi:putative transposase